MMARADYYIETSKEKDQDIPKNRPWIPGGGYFGIRISLNWRNYIFFTGAAQMKTATNV